MEPVRAGGRGEPAGLEHRAMGGGGAAGAGAGEAGGLWIERT